MDGRIEWDPEKAEENRRKHGVSFEEARTAFLDPLALVLEDIVHSQREGAFKVRFDLASGTTAAVLTLEVPEMRSLDPEEILQARHRG